MLSSRRRQQRRLRGASPYQGFYSRSSLALRLVSRGWLARLLLEVLFGHDVVTSLDSLTRRLNFLRVEHQGRSVADHPDNKAIRFFRECSGQIIQLPYFLPVDLVHDAGAIGREIGVRRIRKNVCQDNDFGMLEIELFDNEVIKVMPDSNVERLENFDEIEGEGLEDEPAIHDVARFHVIAVRQIGIRPDRPQFDRYGQWFFVAPNIELHLVTPKLALDDFGHIDA